MHVCVEACRLLWPEGRCDSGRVACCHNSCVAFLCELDISCLRAGFSSWFLQCSQGLSNVSLGDRVGTTFDEVHSKLSASHIRALLRDSDCSDVLCDSEHLSWADCLRLRGLTPYVVSVPESEFTGVLC